MRIQKLHLGPVPGQRGSGRKGFTLLELLAVVAVILVLVGFGGLALRGSAGNPARDGAVAALASLVSQARGLAAVQGSSAAVFVHADPQNPRRYLRYAVVCVRNGPDWRPVDAGVFLPAGVAILPNANPLPTSGPGAFKAAGVVWTRPSGGDLRSTALRAPAALALLDVVSELWSRVEFTAYGTTADTGDLVVAPGRALDASVPVSFQLENPDSVAGFTISPFGALTWLRSRRDF